MLDEYALANSEDEIEILQGPPLGFFDQEEHESEGEKIEPREQSERTSVLETKDDAGDVLYQHQCSIHPLGLAISPRVFWRLPREE